MSEEPIKQVGDSQGPSSTQTPWSHGFNVNDTVLSPRRQDCVTLLWPAPAAAAGSALPARGAETQMSEVSPQT